jgi:hypothetical protein
MRIQLTCDVGWKEPPAGSTILPQSHLVRLRTTKYDTKTSASGKNSGWFLPNFSILRKIIIDIEPSMIVVFFFIIKLEEL